MRTYQHIDWMLLKGFRQSRTNPDTGRPFNQQEIADKIGKKQSYVSRLEKGHYISPDKKVVSALAATFSMQISDFLGYIEKREVETNFIKDVKVTHIDSTFIIKKFTQQYNAKDFPYQDGVLVDNPDWIEGPPVLRNVPDAYAVVMPDISMEPRYREGDILFVNPEIYPTRGDDVVVQLKYKDRTICIIREVVFMENAAPEDADYEVPSYGVISLIDKETIMKANYPVNEDGEPMGARHNPWALLTSNADCFTISETEEKAAEMLESNVSNVWTEDSGKPLAIDIHPIVATQRYRFLERVTVSLKATSTKTAKAEVGQPTIVTENN